MPETHIIELSLYLNMEKTISILLLFALLMSSCTKGKKTDLNGTATIDNELILDQKLQTYINYGFLFSEARLASNVGTPRPDIIIFRDGDNISFEANNLRASFYRFGEYADEQAARKAFNDLTSANISRWEERANLLKINQIWLYRSNNEHYSKIRIISLLTEDRHGFDYVSCSFEWVYQPDGTLTFPGK